jgi:spore coat protein U-like protein
MNTRRVFSLALVIMSVLACATFVQAATATNNLGVQASVAAACSISSVNNLNFGAYDPTSDADNDVASGDMVFRCVKATSYKVYVTGTRQMSDGGTNTLNFQLYNESGRTTAVASDNTVSGTSAASNAPVTKDIYGRIPKQQDAAVASYTATLVATVEY